MARHDHPGVREDSITPQPRALWSGKHGRDLESWFSLHTVLSLAAAHYNRQKGRLIFIGDSITERMQLTRNGDALSQDYVQAHGILNLSELVRSNTSQLVSSWGEPLLLGSGGDQTQHVLWRLEHGELFDRKFPRAEFPGPLIVLHVGTNNLGWGHSPAETSVGVLAVAEYLLTHRIGCKVLLMELLPRVSLQPWPPRRDPRPSKDIAREAVAESNRLIRAGLEGDRFAPHRKRGRVALCDCGAPFRTAVNEWTPRRRGPGARDMEWNSSLLPDGLHPSTAGYALLFDCWHRHLTQLDSQH